MDAFTPYECDRCDDAHMRAWACPDLGLRRVQSIDVDGVQLDQCPGFWKRSDTARWGNLPHMVDVRSAYEIATEARFALEHGGVGLPSCLPGKLHDAVAVILAIETRKLSRDASEARSKRDGRTRLKVV